MHKEINIPMIIHKGSIVGYGGNQEWFSEMWKRSAGCGCTSSVNIAAYYALTHPEMRSLYKGNVDQYDRSEFIAAMEEMYNYMKPGFLGFPFVKKYADQFVKYCSERGVPVEASILKDFRNSTEAIDFVRKNIDEGHPIALLILLHHAKQLKNDNWHWLTITGYIQESEDNNSFQIIVSNYGKRELMDAYALFEVHPRNKIRMVSFCLQPMPPADGK